MSVITKSIKPALQADIVSASLGFQDDDKSTRPIIRTTVQTHIETGGIHGLSRSIKRNKRGGHNLSVYHWVRMPDGSIFEDQVFQIKTIEQKDLAVFDHISVFNQPVDFKSADALLDFINVIRNMVKDIGQKDFPNVIDNFKNIGFNVHKTDGSPVLNGMLSNGHPSFEPNSDKKAKAAFQFPSYYAPALLGYKANKSGENAMRKWQAVDHNQLTKTMVGVQYGFKQTQDDTKELKIVTWRLNSKGKKDKHNIVRLEYQEDAEKKVSIIKKFDFMGQKFLLKDHKNISLGLRAISNIIHQINKGNIPDVLEIIQNNKLQDAITAQTSKPPALASGGRMIMQVLGGNNTQTILYDEDKIGGNAYSYGFEYTDSKGRVHEEHIGLDSGVVFLNRNRTGHDGVHPDKTHYLRHRDNPEQRHQKYWRAIFLTHNHADHIDGIAFDLKAGFIYPPIYCNDDTARKLQENFKSLKVPKNHWPKIRIKKSGERIRLGHFNIYPEVVSHSAKTFAYNVGTPAGHVMHMADFRMVDMDNTKVFNKRRIVAQTQDVTRIAKNDKSISERDHFDNLTELFDNNKEKRLVISFIGSNRSMLETTFDALGSVKRNIVVDGKAIHDLVRTINQNGLTQDKEWLDIINGLAPTMPKLKEYVARKHGVTLDVQGTKEARSILKSDPSTQALIVTGTHDDMMSGMYRLARQVHERQKLNSEKDVVIIQQDPAYDHRGYWNMVSLLRAQNITTITPNEYFKETGKHIYRSGHGGALDAIEAIQLSKAKHIILNHGSAEQLRQGEEVVKKAGKKPIAPTNQDIIAFEKNRAPYIIGQRVENWIYYKNIRPQDVFWNSHVDFKTKEAIPLLRSRAADILKEIRLISLQNKHGHSAERQNIIDAIRFVPANDNVSAPDIYSQMNNTDNPDDVLKSQGVVKKIFYDFETTELGRFAYITQFAANAYDMKGVVSEKINIHQKIPDHIIPSPGALEATNMHYTDLKNGMNPREFSFIVYEFFKKHKKNEQGLDSLKITNPDGSQTDKKSKSNVVGHNIYAFDNVKAQHMFYRAGYQDIYPIQNRSICTDTLKMTRAIAAYDPQAIRIPMRPDPKNPSIMMPSFRLGDLAQENNLIENTDSLHDADEDITLNKKWLDYISEKSPHIVSMMNRNADSNYVTDYLLGGGKGVRGHHRLVSYAVRENNVYKPKMGTLIGIDTEKGFGKTALLFNLDFEPRHYADMSVSELTKVFQNRQHPVFHVERTNKQPMIMPKEFGKKAGAYQGNDESLLQDRKNFIHENPNFATNVMIAYHATRRDMPIDNDYPDQQIYTEPKDLIGRLKSKPDKKLMETLYAPKAWEFDKKTFLEFFPGKSTRTVNMTSSEQFLEIYAPLGVTKTPSDKGFIKNLWKARAENLDKFQTMRARQQALFTFSDVDKKYWKKLSEKDRLELETKVKYRIVGIAGEEFMNVHSALLEADRLIATLPDRVSDPIQRENKMDILTSARQEYLKMKENTALTQDERNKALDISRKTLNSLDKNHYGVA